MKIKNILILCLTIPVFGPVTTLIAILATNRLKAKRYVLEEKTNNP